MEWRQMSGIRIVGQGNGHKGVGVSLDKSIIPFAALQYCEGVYFILAHEKLVFKKIKGPIALFFIKAPVKL